ncbi:MAG: hypothetical protein IKU29_06230 [Parabacteroides sp.]|nr:hypothetical protein [Parabacteroides sp.]
MTQEDKELLLKDICGRLPYNVKVRSYNCEDDIEIVETLYNIDSDGYMSTLECDTLKNITKPYLFPLSGMTEEQKEEYCQLQQKIIYNSKGLVDTDIMNYVNWCYKNHIDCNGLIPMGLALDATNLNIY